MENLVSEMIKDIDEAFKTFSTLSDFYNKIVDIKEKYSNNKQLTKGEKP